jgi:hypothetical protein
MGTLHNPDAPAGPQPDHSHCLTPGVRGTLVCPILPRAATQSPRYAVVNNQSSLTPLVLVLFDRTRPRQQAGGWEE